MPNVSDLLNKIIELEKKCDWLEASDLCEKGAIVSAKVKNLLQSYEFYERKSKCLYLAARQADSVNIFKERIKASIEAREKSNRSLKDMKGKSIEARRIHNKANISLLQSFLTQDSSKKIEKTTNWWNFEKKALKLFEEKKDFPNIAKTCINLVEFANFFRRFISLSPLEQEKLSAELLKYGEKSIKILSNLNNDYELNLAYNLTTIVCLSFTMNPKNQKQLDDMEFYKKKSLDYAKKGLNLSKKNGSLYFQAWSNIVMGNSIGVSLRAQRTYSEYYSQARLLSKRTKDKVIISIVNNMFSLITWLIASAEDNPEKKKILFKKSLQVAQKTISDYKKVGYLMDVNLPHRYVIEDYMGLASIEMDISIKKDLLKKAIASGLEGLKLYKNQHKAQHDVTASVLHGLGDAYYNLAGINDNIEEKKQLLKNALSYFEEGLRINEENNFELGIATNNYHRALILSALAKIELKETEKIQLLNEAVSSINICIEKISVLRTSIFGYVGRFYYWFGRILDQLYEIKKDKNLIQKSIKVYNGALRVFGKFNMNIETSESHWQLAKLHDRLGKYLDSAKDYENAAESYEKVSEKIPKLHEFYNKYASYMKAWHQIEQAKHNHSREEYLQAKIHYENAAQLHEQLEDWRYLSSNYFAWSRIEQAEELSRTEKPQEAINSFQDAIEDFKNTEINIKIKIKEYPTAEEKHLMNKIMKASDLRQKYCQARIRMETAKLLNRKGQYLDCSEKYGEASKIITTIVEKIDVEAERKELEYVAILCQAWEKMAMAEKATSAEAYLEAAELFEEAKEYCYTSRASLWALGNSNFCRGLAAGANYQTKLDLGEHAKAKSFMKSASTHYAKAGFKAASEYAKATQRLFDAYAFMNKAENELDQEKRAKQYQMAENLLQIAAGSFMKAKQPEKTVQVQEILASVREEKALAISLSQVMQAPTIASSTLSFTAPTPTSEVSVGLEKFEHANVQANLVTSLRQVKVGESFCLSVEFVNAGREPALLMRVEDFVPSDFVVVKKPEIYRIEKSCLNMKGKQLAPLKLVEVKLTLQPSKKGKYRLNPRVHYLDERGQNKSLQLKTLEINVKEVILEDRVSSGTQELDSLLLGGIPEGYAVVLTGSPSDEREYLIRNFLHAGIKDDENVFYVSTEAEGLEVLLEKSNFFLFLCNPKPKVDVPDLSNVFKLRGKTDLNNLGIALVKAYRSLDQNLGQPKRICVEILSEVLEDYGSKTTRKWISDLITNYGAKGFTMLAVMYPEMHNSEESKAVLSLFDGEISITKSGDSLECRKSILVKKLRNQDYIKNPICLT